MTKTYCDHCGCDLKNARMDFVKVGDDPMLDLCPGCAADIRAIITRWQMLLGGGAK
jgi:hypothetical protein